MWWLVPFGAVGLVGAVVRARGRFDARVGQEVADLFAAGERAARPGRQGEEALPAPVRRYLSYALPGPERHPSSVRMKWSGQIRSAPETAWWPFVAEQYATTWVAGFVWRARVKVAPGVSVEVVDRFSDGGGRSLAALYGVRTMNDATGAAIDSASLVRWLAEAAWYPAALGAESPIGWEAVDERSARATVSAGKTTATGTFFFAEDGRIDRFEARRARDLGKGRTTEALWTARYDRWELRSEMRVPTEGSVCWELEGGDEFEAGRVKVTELQYGVPMRYVTLD